MKIGVGLVEIKMCKLIVEIAILIVSHLDDAIFHAEGASEIYAYFMVMDFHCPAVQVLAVK